MHGKEIINRYAENPYIRSIVQLIPKFGGIIDTILTDKGSKWRQERFDIFLSEFNTRLEILKNTTTILEERVKQKIDSEEFYNLFIQCSQEALSSSERDKIKYVSYILANYALYDIESDYDIWLFLDITKILHEKEIVILSKILNEDIIYYEYNKNIFNLKQYQTDLKVAASRVDDVVSEKYKIPDNELFTLERLERNFLITIDNDNTLGSIDVSWSKQFQSYHGSVHYLGTIKYSITDFGKRYCKWILGENA